MDIREILSSNIKQIRKRNNLSQSEFAERLGINRTTLYLYESGKRIFPTELIYKLWKMMGVTLEELFIENKEVNS